jgi:phosphonate transport system permease protein
MLRIATITDADIAEARRNAPFAFSRPLKELVLSWLGWTAFAGLVMYCLVRFNFSPFRLWEGVHELGLITRLMFPPSTGGNFDLFFWGILETLGMAFLGTLIGSIIAFPLSFLAAKNIIPAWFFHFGIRRFIDVLRGVDVMIWALIFVRAIGLGPLAGIMAISISDTGTLSKLFSEAIENADRKQMEGVKSAGANQVKVVRFGVVPQVLPVMLSFALYMFESNVRAATILGIVGAGGIGLLLADRIRTHVWDQACVIIILILVTVYSIDFLSKKIREHLIGSTK